MARRDPNHRLAALLLESNCSPDELARAVNALGPARKLALRYDRTTVAHWLTGSRPRPPVPDLVAEALSRRCDRPVTAQETGLTRELDTRTVLDLELRLSPHKEIDPVRRLLALCREDADPARRSFRGAGTYSLAALELPAWVKSASRQPPQIGGPATSADVETLDAVIQVFASLTQTHGGAHARSALVAYLADDAAQMLTAPAPESLHRRLLTGCAQLTHLLAAMTCESGYQRLGQHYFHTALGLAREADDRTTYSVTLRAMSLQASRLGHLRQAAELVEGAVGVAGPHSPPAVRSFLLTQRAVTHATSGHARLTLADLTEAERYHDQSSSLVGPFVGYPRAGLDYQRAQALHALGRPADALEAIRDAAHRSPTLHRPYALTEARLAEILLDVGYLEEACMHWHTFLDHRPHLRSIQVDQALMILRQRLRSFPHQPDAMAVAERARHATKSAPG